MTPPRPADDPTPALFLLPGLDGGASLARPFLDCLPPALAPAAIELPPDVRLAGSYLLGWVGERLPRDRPFFLLGQSFTASLAVALAHRHPVRGLILVTPTLFRRPRWGLAQALRFTPKRLLRFRPPSFVFRWLLLGRDAPAELFATFDASVRAVSAAVLADRLRDLGELFALGSPPEPPCPILCLHAEQDRLLTGPVPTNATGSTRHVALAGPHLLLPRRPAAVAAEVVAFLEGLNPG